MSADKSHRTTSFLIVRDGATPDQVVIWDTLDITVGRLDDQDIVVRDAAVSRKHCVFRRRDGAYTVEDLRSALGTLVNGEPVKVHELVSGDVVEVGVMKIKYGQTENAVKPGANVRFASQLKGFRAVADDASGRTMMAIDLSDDFAAAPAALAKLPTKPRAVSLDGSLEESDAADLVAPGESGFDLGPPPAGVRDLDAALADFAESLGPAARPLASAPIGAAAPGAAPDARVQLLLELAGPPAQVEALVAAIREKPIHVYPITLCVKDPRRR